VAYLPTKLPNATFTGAPVRRLIRDLDIAATRDAARLRFGLPMNSKVIAVTGGSLGSAFLNELTRELVEQHHDRHDLSIIHLTGERYLNADQPKYVPTNGICYLRLPTTDFMHDIYAASDLVISRAGASTVAELATVGRASVLIPWKQAADNHQYFNAQWVGDSGGATVVDEDAVSKQ
jgi:UDP-N-acetylglucosamine--N-acetylmuramyl-(pentapeptide) pyrophosphoryl-undecaprenol N-acetylglucosamine transferase